MRIYKSGLCFAVVMLLISGLAAPVGTATRVEATDPVAQAINWLHGQQLSDGGFGVNGMSGAALTADVVYALALAGEDPSAPAWTVSGRNALTALAALASSYAKYDAGYAGKVARAVVLAGGNPRDFAGLDLIKVIQAAYNPATGRYHANLLFRHTLAVEALLRAGELVPDAALDALINAQLPDGGWFWAFDGEESDVDTTGRVLFLLAGVAGSRCVPSYGQATAYLTSGQLTGGGWGVLHGTGPANADSTALAISGLLTTGQALDSSALRKLGKGPRESLLAFQEPSGAFVYIQQAGKEEVRLVATVDALIVLAQEQAPQVVCRPFYLPIVLAAA